MVDLKTKKRYMVLFRHVSLFFMLAFVPVLFLPVHAVAGPPTADELIALSRQKNLSRDRYWHILMHYGKTLFGFKSQVDDPQFFLAPDGKTNPRAELEATIAALFQPDDEAAQPFVCRFYARFAWLREMLGASDVIVRECPAVNSTGRVSPFRAVPWRTSGFGSKSIDGKVGQQPEDPNTQFSWVFFSTTRDTTQGRRSSYYGLIVQAWKNREAR